MMQLTVWAASDAHPGGGGPPVQPPAPALPAWRQRLRDSPAPCSVSTRCCGWKLVRTVLFHLVHHSNDQLAGSNIQMHGSKTSRLFAASGA